MDEDFYLSPTIAKEDVSVAIEKHLYTMNTNWGEINTITDLYSICDAVSATFNGLPDSILKPSMHDVLIKHIELAENDWIRDHLVQIAKMWKGEANNDKPYFRDTRVIMKAPVYEPYASDKPRKRKKEHYKNGRAMLSVSALLQSTKFALSTTKGNVAVEEDLNGNITLNGEKLTFDSWSRVTKTDDPAIVSLAKNLQIPAELLRTNNWSENDYVTFKRKQGKKQAIFPTTISNGISRSTQPEKLSSDTVHVGTCSPAKQSKELDEGEIDSEEERRMEKRYSKTTVLSSSSEDSDDGFVNARRRRSLLRKTKKSGDSSNLYNNDTLSQLFVYRHQLMMMLPLSQKQKFITFLKTAVKRSS